MKGNVLEPLIKRNKCRVKEFVVYWFTGADGNCRLREAVPLSDLRKALHSAGRSNEFAGYCIYEDMLRTRYLERSAQIDVDDSFDDDHTGPADYKRENAKHLLECDLSESLFFVREELMASTL